jgi:hypothetical protein
MLYHSIKLSYNTKNKSNEKQPQGMLIVEQSGIVCWSRINIILLDYGCYKL